MGLELTIPKEKNYMYADFLDAYWCIEEMFIDIENQEVKFTLNAYPSRWAKYKAKEGLKPEDFIPFGSAVCDRPPYVWQANGYFPLTDVFPLGVPLEKNKQMAAIYNTIKAYCSEVPFRDVLE